MSKIIEKKKLCSHSYLYSEFRQTNTIEGTMFQKMVDVSRYNREENVTYFLKNLENFTNR